MITPYAEILTDVQRGRVVVCTVGVDLDGDDVLCTSTLEAEPWSEFLREPDGETRTANIVGMVVAVAEDIGHRHGVRFP